MMIRQFLLLTLWLTANLICFLLNPSIHHPGDNPLSVARHSRAGWERSHCEWFDGEGFLVKENRHEQRIVDSQTGARHCLPLPTPPKGKKCQFSNLPDDAHGSAVTLILFDLLNTPTVEQPFARRELICFFNHMPVGTPRFRSIPSVAGHVHDLGRCRCVWRSGGRSQRPRRRSDD